MLADHGNALLGGSQSQGLSSQRFFNRKPSEPEAAKRSENLDPDRSNMVEQALTNIKKKTKPSYINKVLSLYFFEYIRTVMALMLSNIYIYYI